MYISDKKGMQEYAEGMLENAFRCLAAAAFCAIFAGIYEIFSHGVYSPFMIGAFTIPLVLGAVPAACIGLYVKKRAEETDKSSEQDPGGPYGWETYEENAFEENTYEEDTYEVNTYKESTYEEKRVEDRPDGICIPGKISMNAWFSGLAALTVGCIFRGVLEIYGTTNRLIVVYPAAATVLLCAALAAFAISFATVQRAMQRNGRAAS